MRGKRMWKDGRKQRALPSCGPDPRADRASWDPEVAATSHQLQDSLQRRAECWSRRAPAGRQQGPGLQHQ